MSRGTDAAAHDNWIVVSHRHPGGGHAKRLVITSWDIARAAGVSQATVSRVLNGRERVAPETRERVQEVINRLGYAPNAIARGLVTSRTQLVGVIVSDVTNPFYPELLDAISARLAEHELRMLFYNAGRRDEQDYVRFLEQHRVEGFVFASAPLDSAVVRELVARSFPLVLTNRYVDDLDCDVVVGDNAAGARAAAAHLLELGHRRIGVIEGLAATSTSRDRVAAFRAELEAQGVELARQFVGKGDFDHDLAYKVARGILEKRPRPTAFFCANDLMAFGAINAVLSLGLRLPDDVSIIGYDAIPMSRWPAFRLTTVRQPLAEMARASVDRLAERIEAPHLRPQRLVFASELLIGSTTGAAPAAARKGRG